METVAASSRLNGAKAHQQLSVLPWARTCSISRRSGQQPADYLLTRANGERIRAFRGTWETLTEAAGLPGLLLHDFRRSAVRNMIRRGVPQKTAMTVSGHKTDAIFSRYNIVSEADIRDAVHKIEQGAQAEIS